MFFVFYCSGNQHSAAPIFFFAIFAFLFSMFVLCLQGSFSVCSASFFCFCSMFIVGHHKMVFKCPTQERGGVSRVNRRLITTSVTSRHTFMIFKMAGNVFVLFLQKMINFRRSGNFFWLARMSKHFKNRKE